MSEQTSQKPGSTDPEQYRPTTKLPEPKAEPPDPPPGGPHAVPGVGGDGAYSTLGRDPDPSRNPATDNELPAETTEPDDTDTEATQENEAQPRPDQESTA